MGNMSCAADGGLLIATQQEYYRDNREVDMADKDKTENDGRKLRGQHGRGGAGGMVYGLGVIGSLIYFLQQAETFWNGALGILEALVWPAFVVYHLLQFLKV
jgi:hypothetical protein